MVKRKNYGKSYVFYWRCISCDDRDKSENKKCCDNPMRVKTVGTVDKSFINSFNKFLDDELELAKLKKNE